jgi:hypothetical protein
VGAPEMVEPEIDKAEPLRAPSELLCKRVRVPGCRERKPLTAGGGLGKINALSGSRMSDRSTSALSGTPARSRRGFSRSVRSRATEPSSRATVRIPRQVLGRLYRMPNFFVTSRVRATVRPGSNAGQGFYSRSRASLRRPQ